MNYQMLIKIRNLAFVLMINLLGLTAINAMQIDPHGLSDEYKDFQSLLASTNNNPTAAYVKVLIDNSIENKEAILDKLECYGADKKLATDCHVMIINYFDINEAFRTAAEIDELSQDEPSEDDIKLFRLFIDLVPDLNLITDYSSILIKTISKSNYIALKLLIETGRVDLDIRDNCGITALIHAVSQESIDAIKLLLDSGANPNIQQSKKYGDKFGPTRYEPNKGDTTLIAAAYIGNKEIIDLLLKADAATSIKNTDGLNALDVAIQQGNHEIAEILKEALVKQNQQKKAFIYFISACFKNLHQKRKYLSAIKL